VSSAPSGTSVDDAVRPGGKIVVGGIAWILSTLVYFVAQVVAAAAWNRPSYSWTGNYISGIGQSVRTEVTRTVEDRATATRWCSG
jgi:hypothetical protein